MITLTITAADEHTGELHVELKDTTSEYGVTEKRTFKTNDPDTLEMNLQTLYAELNEAAHRSLERISDRIAERKRNMMKADVTPLTYQYDVSPEALKENTEKMNASIYELESNNEDNISVGEPMGDPEDLPTDDPEKDKPMTELEAQCLTYTKEELAKDIQEVREIVEETQRKLTASQKEVNLLKQVVRSCPPSTPRQKGFDHF